MLLPLNSRSDVLFDRRVSPSLRKNPKCLCRLITIFACSRAASKYLIFQVMSFVGPSECLWMYGRWVRMNPCLRAEPRINTCRYVCSMDLGVGGGCVFGSDNCGGARDGGTGQKLGVGFATGESILEAKTGTFSATWYQYTVQNNEV